MLKAFVLAILVLGLSGAWCERGPFLNKLTENSGRQKRLLFYDEQGQLVKTFGNSIYQYGKNEQENLFYWSFLNTFLSPIFPTSLGRTSIAYMVPVSDAVLQEINRDPIYQNKLLYLTYRDPIVESNPLCAGRRAQIPSPKLCSNFLNCWDGWAFEQECPAGLLFSNDGYCDYPHNVDCKNRNLKEPLQPLCSKDFVAFGNKMDCSEFFVCVHNLPVRFKCPADLAYSEPLGICDYPSRVECNVTIGSISNTPSSVQPIQLSTELPPPAPSTSTSTALPAVSGSSFTGDKNILTNKMEYNTRTQSWSSTHVAISRQDAIRQLQLEKIAKINKDN